MLVSEFIEKLRKFAEQNHCMDRDLIVETSVTGNEFVVSGFELSAFPDEPGVPSVCRVLITKRPA